MTNNTQHEEWKVGSFVEKGAEHFFIKAENACVVCEFHRVIGGDCHSNQNAKAHAQSIVTAHNVMPELIEVVEEYVEMMQEEFVQHSASHKPYPDIARLERANKLLKRIGGGENG